MNTSYLVKKNNVFENQILYKYSLKNNNNNKTNIQIWRSW